MSEEDNTEQEIKRRVTDIFPNAAVAKTVIDLALAKKPVGWSLRSNAPYYKEVYALEIKDNIDTMIRTGEGFAYRYSIWCQGGEGISERTLYIKINQSIRYLIDKLDTDHTYHNWYQRIEIKKKPGLGIIIEYNDALNPGNPTGKRFQAEPLSSLSKRSYIEQKIDEWLESESIKPFDENRLALSAEEIQKVKEQLAGVDGIAVSISATSVKIIRMR